MDLQQLVKFYLDYQRTYNKPSSVSGCRYHTKALMRCWGGDRELESITGKDVERFVGIRLKTLKPISVNKHLRVLRAMFNYAVDSGFLSEVPFKIRMLRAPKKRDLSPLTKDEIYRLIRTA